MEPPHHQHRSCGSAIVMFTHPYHDIEIEAVPGESNTQLIKILAQDGRRFTYRLRGDINEGSMEFLRRMIEGGITSDLLIEYVGGEFRAEESPNALPKHG